jgi:hypothetical protein
MVHAFEQAGLGKAPFKYAGEQHQEISYGERVIGSAGGIPLTTKPGGTCAYCGQYIVVMHNIQSADGQRFHVGSDCVRKTGDAGLIRRAETTVKQRNKQQRAAKKAAQFQADRELCERADLSQLANRPHPNEYYAKEGRTLADWAEWCRVSKVWGKLAAVLRKAGQ